MAMVALTTSPSVRWDNHLCQTAKPFPIDVLLQYVEGQKSGKGVDHPRGDQTPAVYRGARLEKIPRKPICSWFSMGLGLGVSANIMRVLR